MRMVLAMTEDHVLRNRAAPPAQAPASMRELLAVAGRLVVLATVVLAIIVDVGDVDVRAPPGHPPLENCIASTSIKKYLKLQRANGGCLGARCR